MSTPPLSFQAFQAQREAAFPDSDPPPGKAERYGLYAMLAGAGTLILAASWAFDSVAGKILVLLGLAVELAGGAIHLGAGFVRMKQGMKFDSQSGAEESERDFQGYRQIVTWLRGFPEDERQSRLIFAKSRAESWQTGASLVMGGLEKLGLLPVLVALYVQFKDVTWSWPPDVTVVGTLIAFPIIVFYALGLWAVSRRRQVLGFERFLTISLDENFKLASAASEPPRRSEPRPQTAACKTSSTAN